MTYIQLSEQWYENVSLNYRESDSYNESKVLVSLFDDPKPT